MLEAARGLAAAMWTRPGASGAERPTAVKAAAGRASSRFRGTEQQDSQEFLRCFLDALHEDANEAPPGAPYAELTDPPGAPDADVADEWWSYDGRRNASALRDLFAGQARSCVTCGECGHRSRAFDPFWDLGVPIPRSAQVRSRRTGLVSSSAVGGACSLGRCLDAYVAPEDLGRHGYRCSACRAEACSKATTLWRLPPVLVIVLKRFTYTTYRRAKITASVALPEHLDAAPLCSPGSPGLEGESRYTLWGVVHHSGSLHGGHYFADCRNLDTGRWHTHNDSRVSPSSLPSGGASPYILFYVRNDAAPPAEARGGRL